MALRSLDSVDTWLTQLNNFVSATNGTNNPISNNVLVKGVVNISADSNLNYSYNNVNFIGDNGTFITGDIELTLRNNVSMENLTITTIDRTELIIGNNVSLNNITFNYNFDPVVSGDSDYIQGTYQLINVLHALIHIDFLGNTVSNLENINITNCDFIWQPDSASTSVNRYPFILAHYYSFGQMLSNINISNNTFTSNFAGEIDSLGAIVFTDNYYGSSPPSGQAPQLVNCEISSNIFNSNQIIAITSLRNSTNSQASNPLISSAINTIDVVISDNACGAIGTLNYAYLSYDSNGNAMDRNTSLIVSNNTCIYIGTLDGAGQEVFSSGSNVYNIVSGSIDINNNNCSWIRIGYVAEGNWPVNLLTAFALNNNVLIPNNAALKNLYRAGSAPDHALTVTAAQGSSYAEATISGNIVTYGNQGATVSGENALGSYPNQYYGYTEDAIYANANSTITGNIITGFAIDAIYLDCNDAIVQNNRIYRGNHNVNSYVNGNGSGTHSVENNFFDGGTVNGTNENTIINMSPNGTYARNKNQIGYAAISFLDATMGAAEGFGIIVGTYLGIPYASTSSYFPTQNYPNNLSFYFQNTTAYAISIIEDIGSKLPENVTILQGKIGFASRSGDNGQISVPLTLTVSLNSQDIVINNFNLALPNNSILDPHYYANDAQTSPTGTLTFNTTADLSALITQTAYVNIVINDNNFITNTTKNITCTCILGVELSGGSQWFEMSPLVIKYKW